MEFPKRFEIHVCVFLKIFIIFRIAYFYERIDITEPEKVSF